MPWAHIFSTLGELSGTSELNESDISAASTVSDRRWSALSGRSAGSAASEAISEAVNEAVTDAVAAMQIKLDACALEMEELLQELHVGPAL